MARKAGGGFSFTILGRKPIDRAFEQLPERLARKVVRQAMRKAMKPVAAQVKANAPVDTGATRRAVKVRAARRTRKGFGVNVQVGEGDYKGDTFPAAMVEYGTADRRKKSTGQHVGRVKARRFLHRAYRQKKDEARRIADREISAGIGRELAALSEKAPPKGN